MLRGREGRGVGEDEEEKPFSCQEEPFCHLVRHHSCLLRCMSFSIHDIFLLFVEFRRKGKEEGGVNRKQGPPFSTFLTNKKGHCVQYVQQQDGLAKRHEASMGGISPLVNPPTTTAGGI